MNRKVRYIGLTSKDGETLWLVVVDVLDRERERARAWERVLAY